MVEAPGRTKLPDGSGRPCWSSGVTRSPSRRCGIADSGGALLRLPDRAGGGAVVPVGDSPEPVPVVGVGACVATEPVALYEGPLQIR